jgi:peptidoglycan hydrolase-like protein with peptidoglycan-binding domain
MPLISNLFKNNKQLQACLVQDPSHVTPGSVGEHVALIQIALNDIDNLIIEPAEVAAKQYGLSTAAAVLAFKKKRKIINRSYQSTEDNIVGKMTIAALDKEMFDMQFLPASSGRRCKRSSLSVNPPPSPPLTGKTFNIR